MQLLRLDDFYFEDAGLFATPPPSKAEELLNFRMLQGRLCEFSSFGVQAVGSLAARYVWEAQQAGAWPVWISKAGIPLAEDLQACGIDLRALPVICTETTAQSLHAAERVMRSSVCGVVVIDLGDEAYVPAAMMGRMLKLAQRTETACLVLSNRKHRPQASLSPLVSLRIEAHQTPVYTKMERPYLALHAQIVRDKKTGRNDGFEMKYRPNAGMF